jgi:hypothetical protein
VGAGLRMPAIKRLHTVAGIRLEASEGEIATEATPVGDIRQMNLHRLVPAPTTVGVKTRGETKSVNTPRELSRFPRRPATQIQLTKIATKIRIAISDLVGANAPGHTTRANLGRTSEQDRATKVNLARTKEPRRTTTANLGRTSERNRTMAATRGITRSRNQNGCSHPVSITINPNTRTEAAKSPGRETWSDGTHWADEVRT